MHVHTYITYLLLVLVDTVLSRPGEADVGLWWGRWCTAHTYIHTYIPPGLRTERCGWIDAAGSRTARVATMQGAGSSYREGSLGWVISASGSRGNGA
ncbi:uncharacterized protein P884DRAFT_38132 [Thermothelomyces heterothallicus CBS 202.75]|uniref:uncharacterized protein n=1 Tax=Thermothelomyces heterothallicus CBS 202.75 TaxID=1149848 RepID=UPI00374328EA